MRRVDVGRESGHRVLVRGQDLDRFRPYDAVVASGEGDRNRPNPYLELHPGGPLLALLA